MNWFSGTPEDDAIFNGYVMKLVEDRKPDLLTALASIANLDQVISRDLVSSSLDTNSRPLLLQERAAVRMVQCAASYASLISWLTRPRSDGL